MPAPDDRWEFITAVLLAVFCGVLIGWLMARNP